MSRVPIFSSAMNRLVVLLLALSLVAAACGSGEVAVDETTATVEAPAGTTAPTDGGETETTDAPGTTGGSGGETLPPESGVDGPAAPDVAIPYEGGSDLLLSQEVLPVYLVFWAEW